MPMSVIQWVVVLTPLALLVNLLDDCYLQLFSSKDQKPLHDQRLILVSFDAFRYDYLNPELTPNLHKIITEDGVTGHMISTFTTKTFPNHHSIATGLYQERHGIVNNVMFDEKIGEVFVHKKAEHCSNEWFDNCEATPMYIANQLYQASRASACAPWIGCHATYFGSHRAKHFRHYNLSAEWEEQFDWAVEKMTRRAVPANLVMMYVPYPDVTSHEKGPFASETLEKVRQVDRLVGYMRERLEYLELAGSTNLIIVSDHGMAEISADRRTILDSFLNTSWYDAYGASPVVHVRPKPGYDHLVAKSLHDYRSTGHFRVYTKATMPHRYHYRFHRRILRYVLVADEGWSLYLTQADAEAKRNHHGQHGYDNLLDSMRPLFAATGPGFKRGYAHPLPFVNVDLYPLMLTLLGIPRDRFFHQGEFDKVKAMLVDDFWK